MDGKQILIGVGGVGAASTTGPVSVTAPETGAEVAVIGRERWEEIRRMAADGGSVSKIAQVTGLDRKTVRRCLRQKQWRPYRRANRAVKLLDAHRAWLEVRAPQVHYSAQILFQELRANRGYPGGYDTVRNAVRPLRAEAAVSALTQRRFETGPGEQAQVDWGQVRTHFSGVATEVHIFVLTLGYSRRAWAEGYENERLSALLEAHEHAFAHFGGCTAEILYDRMRTVSSGTTEGRVRWNPTF
jgi:transposase